MVTVKFVQKKFDLELMVQKIASGTFAFVFIFRLFFYRELGEIMLVEETVKFV